MTGTTGTIYGTCIYGTIYGTVPSMVLFYGTCKQQVPDKWRDACKLRKLIKFGAVSYNN